MCGRVVLFLLLIVVSIQTTLALTATEVYKKVMPSVYSIYGIEVDSGQRVASGTGIAVSKDLLATNCHIVQGAEAYEVKINAEMKKGRLIYNDLSHDICLIEVPDYHFRPVTFRKSADVEIGEEVYAIGNPYGLERTISRGIISNKHKFWGGALLQTDATISFGSSGGGLFDKNGNLIGITRAGHQFKNIAFAVPSEWVTNLLQAVQAQQHAQGLNITIAQQLTKTLGKINLNIEKIGSFGRDKISIYRFQGHCFFAFPGESDHKPGGMMLWYPEHRQMIYFVPYENTVLNAMRMMIKNGYVDRATGNLLWDSEQHNSAIPVILQSFEVVTKEFSVDPQSNFSKNDEVVIHYPDYRHNYQEIDIHFGMLGFNKAYHAFSDLCVMPKTK